MKLPSLFLGALFVFAAGVPAAAEKETDFPVRFDSLYSLYDVNPDGSHSETHRFVKTLLKESAVEEAKKVSFSFSTSIQDGEVLEAYTLKQDGRRIEVPPGNYQVSTNGGRGSNNPFFSDRTFVTVVYPDVAVGDKIAFAYRIKGKEPMFPGYFSLYTGFSKYAAYDEGRIEVRLPLAFKAQTASYHVETQPETVSAEKRIYQWTYKNSEPLKWESTDAEIDVPEDNPVIMISTFSSYQQIAAEYGRRARPKAAVTERVRELATAITAGLGTKEEKARALYDWVAQNISYGGNCIGVGAVVPRDIDVILDNRIGDCKDHATLLQALLAAVDIKSTQALINAGMQYELPRIPVVANVNHVINYLPDFNLYLDSTAGTIPYGMLPMFSAGKPALLMDDFKKGTRTPPELGTDNVQIVKTRIKVNTDGTAAGQVEVNIRGAYAINFRNWVKSIAPSRYGDIVKQGLQGAGYQGNGQINLEDPKGLDSKYQYSVTFELEDFLRNIDAGAIGLSPLLAASGTVASFINLNLAAVPEKSRVCTGGHSTEEYVIEMPASMKVLALPKDREFSADGLSYRATYELKDNTILVSRKIDDVIQSNVCSATQLATRQKLQKQVLRDIRSQILYQQNL